MKHSISDYGREAGMYPYVRPGNSYLLDGDSVLDLDCGSGANEIKNAEIWPGVSVNDYLRESGLAPMEDRIPVVAYGSNANPEILRRKMAKVEGISGVVPTIRGRARGYDVVHAARVTGGKAQSIPAQIIDSEGTEPEVWLNLLDPDQAKRMHDSESLRKGHYCLAPMTFITEDGTEITAYGYFGGDKPVYIDPDTEEPVPVALAGSDYRGENGILVPGNDFVPVDARGRALPERSQGEMADKFSGFSTDRFGKGLYKGPGALTEWGAGALGDFNELLGSEHGRVMDPEVDSVETPYNIDSLAKLGDSA